MQSLFRAACAAACALIVCGTAAAACPTGAVCIFATDTGGSSTVRSPNVNSAMASASFLSGLVGVGTERFESIAGGTLAPISLNFPGAGTATLTGGGNVEVQGSGTNGSGRYPISGTHYFAANSAAGGGTTFTINFTSPVAAFGFYGVDIGEFGSQLSLRFTLVGGGGTQTWELPYTATNGINTARDGSILYAGFVSPVAFTSVAFIGTSSDDIFAFDDMTIASPSQVVLPEPQSWMLLVGGFAAIRGLTRRRGARRAVPRVPTTRSS